MSEQFIDFFMTITPTILTSVTGFLLGKYNYFQNRPLDKMEIAYDRVYYPIERIMREKSIKISTVIDRAKIYFLKYEKYIDKSTVMIYKQLCKCKDEEEQQSIYDSFRNNIHNECIFLRKKLGYLQPGYLQIYLYLPTDIKRVIRLLLEFSICYFSACVFSVVKIDNIKMVCLVVFAVSLCAVLVEVIYIIIGKIITFIKQKVAKGYCFIVDAGMQYLFVNGKVDENINSCFQKTRTMQAKLDVLKPISGIREVFAHFIVECVYKKDNYNICFDYLSGKVKAEIKEQDLRNILLQYLEKNMRGEVSVEFCTDYLNDEESVDIYIYDGCQRAIIEVKFSLPEKYYAGSTHYSITARTGDGIKQLDKYARHLAKDGRLVDFGYVYMFYMSDVKKETLMSRIDNKTNELLRGLSDELNSIFDGVEMNDMKCWGTAS